MNTGGASRSRTDLHGFAIPRAKRAHYGGAGRNGPIKPIFGMVCAQNGRNRLTLFAARSSVPFIFLIAGASAQTCDPLAGEILNTQIAASPVLDYLVQNVCIDASNKVIPGDPAVCPLSRNVKIGEKVPYLMTDLDRRNGGARYQGNFSYPVVGEDGALKIVWMKQLTGAGRPTLDANYQY